MVVGTDVGKTHREKHMQKAETMRWQMSLMVQKP